MFEHSLIALEATPQPGRRWLSLPIAVGLHVVGLTAFAFASYWNVATVPDPQLNAQFISVILPPLLSGNGGGQKPLVKPKQKKQAAQQTPQKIVQPNARTVPDKPPAPATKETVNVPMGPATGDPNPEGGPGDGCVGCPPGPGPQGPGPGGPGGPNVEPSGSLEPIHLSFGMTKPEIVHQVQPRYSEMARRAGVQGTVIVEAVIDEQGRVTHERLLRSVSLGLDQAALEAIQQWRFKPALLDGRPVKVYFTLTVNFTIQR